MTDHSKRLLNMPCDELFAHGGCHIFAMELRRIFDYPLLLITKEENQYHVACAPEDIIVLDVYGWVTRAKYEKDDFLDGIIIKYTIIQEKELRSCFTEKKGLGYYYHESFRKPAIERAKKWIDKHYCYFNGDKKEPISWLKRVKMASQDVKIGIFAKEEQKGGRL